LRRSAGPPAFPLRPHTVDEDVPAMKRAMDITGSLIALVLLSPLFLGVALAIKLTSKGPVFSRQKRIGQYGVPFVFLKFRSMYVNNDASIHKTYVKQLIAGKAERYSVGSGKGVYKLTKDARITRIGGFLRRTSLDELPQFINVLKGETTLVGPRPRHRFMKSRHTALPNIVNYSRPSPESLINGKQHSKGSQKRKCRESNHRKLKEIKVII
jgi:lipopolysaccharide/colanic/teichoic acid biosynthesis glycosyltransferase